MENLSMRIENVKKIVLLLNRLDKSKNMTSIKSIENDLDLLFRGSLLAEDESIQELLYSPVAAYRLQRMQLRALIKSKGLKIPATLHEKKSRARKARAIVVPGASMAHEIYSIKDQTLLQNSPGAYFRRVSNGLILNLKAVRARLKRSGMEIINFDEIFDEPVKIYTISIHVSPRDRTTLDRIRNEIDTWITQSAIRDDVNDILPIITKEGYLNIMIENGITYLHDQPGPLDD